MNQRLPALRLETSSARSNVQVHRFANLREPLPFGSFARPARKVTVPVHTGDLPRGTLRAIISQASLTVAEFIAYL
jgi:hypothetical protein